MRSHEELIRLELVKLAHRHDRDAAEVVKRAEELEKYVRSQAPERDERKPPQAEKDRKHDPLS